MSLEKTDALVIRQADWSESSRVVTFFTREFGKVAVIAKGAKRLKSSFEVALDLLTTCRIVFFRKSSSALDILTEAKLLQRFKPRSGDIRSLYCGYFVAELLDGLSEEYDPHPQLYDEAQATLNVFATDGPLELAMLRFELAVLREIGQLPNFDECVMCGEPAIADVSFDFKVTQGGLVCQRCPAAQSHANPDRIQSGSLAVLRCLTGETESAWQRLAPSSTQLKEIRSVVTAAISHVLGRRPRMLSYLRF
jgi:DNA repair protein RecO (recombination protein O)